MPYDLAPNASPALQTKATPDVDPARKPPQGFVEGSDALSPRVQKKEEPGKAPADAAAEKEKARQEAARKGYEQLLGEYLGSKLYDLVAKELAADKLLKYGNDGLDSAVKAVPGLFSPADGFQAMDEKSEAAAVGKFAQALASWGKDKSAEWLKSEDGTKFLTKCGQWFEGHPGVVVALALTAAATAVAMNVDVPELAQKFKLGNGLTGEAAIDPGRIRDLVVQGARLGLTWKKGETEAGIVYKYAKGEDGKDDTHSVAATAKLSGEKTSLAGTLTASSDGSWQIDTQGDVKGDGWKLGAGYKVGQELSLGTVGLTMGDETHETKTGVNYDFQTGKLSISNSETAKFKFGTVSRESSWSPDETKHGVGAKLNLGNDLKANLDYSMSSLKGQFAGGSVEKKWDDWTLKASGRYNLTDTKLDSMALSFGYRDPKEFKSFLADYKRSWENEVPTDRLNLMVEHSLHDVMFRVQNQTRLDDGKLSENVTSAHAAYMLNKDVGLIGGARYGVQADGVAGLSDRNRGLWLEAGAQVKGVPLVLGVNPETRAVSFGITIPFGR